MTIKLTHLAKETTPQPLFRFLRIFIHIYPSGHFNISFVFFFLLPSTIMYVRSLNIDFFEELYVRSLNIDFFENLLSGCIGL